MLRLIGMIVAVLMVVVLIQSVPDIKRYLEMSRM
jgi:hypothetical protein